MEELLLKNKKNWMLNLNFCIKELRNELKKIEKTVIKTNKEGFLK